MLGRLPRPSLNDAIEIAGVVLVGFALSLVYLALGLGAVGAYLLLVANLRPAA